jgi:hypothetical protein
VERLTTLLRNSGMGLPESAGACVWYCACANGQSVAATDTMIASLFSTILLQYYRNQYGDSQVSILCANARFPKRDSVKNDTFRRSFCYMPFGYAPVLACGDLETCSYRTPVLMRFSIASTLSIPPRAPIAVQFSAAAAQAKSSCRASGQPCNSP